MLGIGMGDPYFKIKNLCLHQNVVVGSSNYQLYGSISQRVMNALVLFSAEVEVYSIDEAFLRLSASMNSEDVIELCKRMRDSIRKWVGIPISIGIASTKTLAKAANKIAKTTQNGVVSMESDSDRMRFLEKFPIADVWGIGFRLKDKLKAIGINTALEFCKMEPTVVRQKMGVIGERMLWELRGVSCLPLIEEQASKKSITCSRSFGVTLTDLEPMLEAISSYASTACEKLRQERSCAKAVYVFTEALMDIQTEKRLYNSVSEVFPLATNDTPMVITLVKNLLTQLYVKGQRYKKCGLVLLDLVSENTLEPDLFQTPLNPKRRKLAQTVDALNGRYGKNTLIYAAAGINPSWKMKCQRRSGCYTTCWNELAIVKA